ncbi:hypothetical protein [Mesorhizobium sp. CAU 1741]|uniref:hypothetical protein n=1 Tax=Mesorhizobium sp. CAU 1741 TaxID=3140366 RepID=UPI00325C0FA9
MNAATETTLRVMPREMRMMSERILSLTGLPKGFVLAETDIIMLSQGLGLGGFALIEDRFDALKLADPAAITIASEDGPVLRLDAAGQHAWVAIPSLLDLAGELVARFGTAEITVANVVDESELQVAAEYGRRRGLRIALDANDGHLLLATPLRLAGDLATDEPVLWSLLTDGTPIAADLWWRIYERAQKALTPDSVVSRRHAGPLIVNDDGTVIGRRDNDDETDISFLAAPDGGRETERQTS